MAACVTTPFLPFCCSFEFGGALPAALHMHPPPPPRRLYPTPEAQRLAATHALVTQTGAFPVNPKGWWVADVSSDQLRAWQQKAGESPALPPLLEALRVIVLGRAPSPRQWLLRAFWWVAPCPEPTLLLLDWLWVGGRPAPVLGALVDRLSAFDVLGARRLAFAQIIVSSQPTPEAGTGLPPPPPVLITRRNTVALEALRQAFAAGDNRVALLYGVQHVPDLLQRLLADGMQVVGSQWMTVWQVSALGHTAPGVAASGAASVFA